MSLVFWRTVNGYMYPNGGYYPYMSAAPGAGPHAAPTPAPPHPSAAATCPALSPLSGAGPTIPSALALAAAATGGTPAAAASHKWMLPSYLSSQQMYMFLPKMAKPKTERVNKAVKCEICNLTLNSELQAQQHYNGKNHLKKMKQLGMPLPGEDEGKKVIQQYTSEANSEGNEDSCQGDLNDLTQGGVLLEEADGCLDGATGSPSSGQSSQSTGPPSGQSGQQQTDQQQQKLDPVSQAVYDNILGKLPRKRKMEIPCSVCDMIFNSEAQASQHFRGVKHAKRLKMVEDLKSPSKTSSDGEGSVDGTPEAKSSSFYCHYCGVALNSPQQLEEHQEGQLHKKMVERKTTVGPAARRSGGCGSDDQCPSSQQSGMLYCQVCDISVPSQSKLQQHVQTAEHEERVTAAAGRTVVTTDGVGGAGGSGGAHSPPPSPLMHLS